jgi:hypothetical protein
MSWGWTWKTLVVLLFLWLAGKVADATRYILKGQGVVPSGCCTSSARSVFFDGLMLKA